MQLMSEWAAPIRRVGTSGETFVLIHGFTGHPGHWIPIADRLHALGHSVVAPRLAGHGTSPDDLAGTGPDDWIASVIEPMTHPEVTGRIHLAGLSMGAMLALIAAGPTAAATITTINAPVHLFERRGVIAPAISRLMPFVDVAADEAPDPDLAHLWMPYLRYSTKAVAGLHTVMRRGKTAARRLRRPSLVIQSKVDTVVRPSSGPILARMLGADLMWLDNARHNAIIDPERTRIAAALASMASR